LALYIDNDEELGEYRSRNNLGFEEEIDTTAL
jgi:hypothetical protein